MARRCCCGDACQSKSYDTVGSWSAVGDATISDAGTAWIDPLTNIQTFDVDGEVNPASFVTGKEAWEIEFYMRGQATFTIDSVDYVIDTDAQTISAGAVTDSIGVSGNHLPSDELFLFRLRVTPTHAYLLGYGNYLIDTVNYEYRTSYAFSLLTVDRSGDAPDSFSIVWTDAVVGGFSIRESTVAVTADYVPSYSRLCWTAPTTTCPYPMVKRMSRNHMYLADPSHLQDYPMPDITMTGWDSWTYFAPDCPSTPKDWATGTVFKCPGDDPTELYQTHDFGTFCSFAGPIRRWNDTGGGSYECITSEVTVNGAVTLDWGTPTNAAPYPKPVYQANFGCGYARTILCCFEFPATYHCRYELTSGGSVAISIAANDLKNGFTLSVSGTHELEEVYNNWENPECRFEYNPYICDFETNVTPQYVAGLVGTISGQWSV